MTSRTYRRRAVIATMAVSTLAALVLIAIVQVVFADSSHIAQDRILAARTEAVIRSVRSASNPAAGIDVPDDQLGGGIAVFDSRGTLLAGSVPPAYAGTYAQLERSASAQQLVVGETAVRAQPFQAYPGAGAVVVAAQDLDPYRDQDLIALWVATAAGVVIVLLTTGLAAWASKRVLAPVLSMAAAAETWSEHNLAHRFNLGPPTNEIGALGHTLDGLLDKVAGAIAAEQRLTSELAHELRTPLTTIRATADLISLRDDLDPLLREDIHDISQAALAMGQAMSALLELARQQGGVAAQCRIDDALARALDELDDPARVCLRSQPCAPVAAPVELTVRTLAPVLHNALRHGVNVVVTATQKAGMVLVTVADDGPGIPAEGAARIFEPGESAVASSGLGLPLARRIARSVGGEVSVADPGFSGAGATFLVALPTVSVAKEKGV